MTEQQAIKRLKSEMEWESIELNREAFSMGIKALKEIQQYRAIGTVEELQTLKEKNDKDFELLLKEVKEAYPMFKEAYVELDIFMGDVMRRFVRDRNKA